MKIFVTGGSGFLGKSIAQALLKNGHTVSVLIRNQEEKTTLEKLGFKTIIGDLDNLPDDCLSEVDAVYHFAAIRYEWGFSREEYWKTNVQGTQNLLEESVTNKVNRFVYCSTAFVHGHSNNILDENSPFDPKSLYAQSKLEAEKLVQKYARENSLFSIILRPSMVYGPEDKTGMFLKLCRLIQKRSYLSIGNGKNNIHLSYINDVVNGFLLALKKGVSGEAYIIASPQPISLQNLIAFTSKELGVKIMPFQIPFFLAGIVGFLFEIIYYCGQKLGLKYFFREPLITRSKVNIIANSQNFDSSKAREGLGFESKMSYPEGISKTIEWYKTNGYL